MADRRPRCQEGPGQPTNQALPQRAKLNIVRQSTSSLDVKICVHSSMLRGSMAVTESSPLLALRYSTVQPVLVYQGLWQPPGQRTCFAPVMYRSRISDLMSAADIWSENTEQKRHGEYQALVRLQAAKPTCEKKICTSAVFPSRDQNAACASHCGSLFVQRGGSSVVRSSAGYKAVALFTCTPFLG